MRHDDNIKIINLNNEPITHLSIYLLRILCSCHQALGIHGLNSLRNTPHKGKSHHQPIYLAQKISRTKS